MARRRKVRWLSDEEQDAWRAFLFAVRRLGEQLDRELQRDAGMPHTYYEILVALSEEPDRTLRMSRLAELTRSSRSRLSHAISRLEDLGWVSRCPTPTDKRGAMARLTHDGFKVLAAAAPGHVESVRRHLVDKLTPEEFAELGRISAKILEGLDDPPCD